MRRKAENNVNYQLRTREFSVGDRVSPYGYPDSHTGRVTAVWPAIGMVDVEFPAGPKRFPVEDVQRFDHAGVSEPPYTSSVPGGTPTVYVPNTYGTSARRVVQAFVKNAVYWAGPDRKYRLTRSESQEGCFYCPKCGADHVLRRTVYKRYQGKSERLLGCGSCLFLVKESDIINHKEAAKRGMERDMDYGTSYADRAKRKYTVYSYAKGGVKEAIEDAQRHHPGKRIVDLLLVSTSYSGVNEWLYNTREG